MQKRPAGTPKGVSLLRNPWLNKGSAYCEAERDALGLRGLLPPHVSSIAEQVARIERSVAMAETPLQKYLALETVHATNETLYFRVLMKNLEQYLPLVYTPTVGEACRKFSRIFQFARGLYVSCQDRGRVRELLANVPNSEVDIIVVTDGERILGLGDLGINGMGIPIGKLALYTACAGLNPQRALPVTIDVGTNNEEILADPMYLGLRQKRTTGEAYDALLAEFIEAARERWPNVLIQFEDFHNRHAYPLLNAWRHRVTCFNDDIQGTAAVCLAGLYSAMRLLQRRLKDERVLFLGAGSAAMGIAHLIVEAIEGEGLSKEAARSRIALFDSKGLVTRQRDEAIEGGKAEFASDFAPARTFEAAVRTVRPSAIVGVSAQFGAFTQGVIEAMSEINASPIIFALSNPTSKAECTAQDAYRYSGGRAVFACGSPFEPVSLAGKTFVPRQGNNCYVFPGIGLGCVFARAKEIPDELFLVAAKRLSEMVTVGDLVNGSLYPPLTDVRMASFEIAVAVAECLFENGLAQIERPLDLREALADAIWTPDEHAFEYDEASDCPVCLCP